MSNPLLVTALDNPIDTFILFHIKIDCLHSLCLGKSVPEVYSWWKASLLIASIDIFLASVMTDQHLLALAIA